MSKMTSYRAGWGGGHLLLLVITAWMLIAETGQAQVRPGLIPPAPLGSPAVSTGPIANPFGPPPMAIGPVPPRGQYAYDVYGRPTFPSWAYPAPPYWVWRPTPFDVSAPAQGDHWPTEAQSFSEHRTERQANVEPTAIGNLQLTVSEGFLNRFVAREEQKPGDVHDFILGAQVTGRQTTATNLRLKLLPCENKIRGVLVLNGTTQSQTKGVTPQAMVEVASQQQFTATKEIFFDGQSLSTRHAVVQVNARNQTLGAVTPFSGTLIGGIADRIAYREAQRRRPEAEAIARDRVADRVYPEFDNGIDRQLASANDQLGATVRPMLRSANLLPTWQSVSSNDGSLTYAAQIASEAKISSPSGLECQLGKDDGACLLLHESFFNGLIVHSGLKGSKTTDKNVRELLAPYEVKPTTEESENQSSPIAMPGLANVETEIEFDETAPLVIQIERDRTLVTLRATFRPAGQDLLPQLAVKIEYKTELIGDKLVVSPGKVKVDLSKSDDTNSIPSIALTLISKAIESNLTKLEFDRALPASLWSFAGTAPRIVGIRTSDGWAAVSID